MRRGRPGLWLLLLSAALAARGGDRPASSRLPQAEIARAFAEKFPSLHVEPIAFDETVGRRALDLYLSSLDGDRSFFLASDVAAIRGREGSAADRLKQGDVALAHESFEVFRKRVEERCAYVETLLRSPPNLQAREEYQWYRRRAPWPANEAEQNTLWRQKIADQYIRRVLAEERPAPAAAATNRPAEAVTPAAHGEFILKQYRQYLSIIKDHDEEWIFQQYMSAFAHAYDPHSDYMSPSTVEDFDISMRLSLSGIGARLSSEDGAAKVVEVIKGGAADRDGRLKAGDKIIGVGQAGGDIEDVLHWPLYRTVRKIRGAKGTKVVLLVIPASDPAGTKTVKIDLVREDVKLEAQEAKGALRDVKGADGTTARMGVITLPGFYADLKARSNGSSEYKSSARDVKNLLLGMVSNRVAGIVLDLRGDGGGSLPEAVDMTGLFIRSGPVVQVRDRRGVGVLQDFNAEVTYEGPLVVLIDRMSASASEILAGALQDYGRAVLVGDARTHGKGTVQSVIPMKSGADDLGSIKVTTQTFYRFTGPSTQVQGVSADIALASPYDAMDIGEMYLDYALPWSRIAAVDLTRPAPVNLMDGLLFWRTARDVQPVVDLRGTTAALRARSEARRKQDPRHAAREKLLARFAERQKRRTISLCLDERREQAKEELKLEDMQKADLDGDGASEDKPKDAPKTDLVLEEGLQVLSDWLALQAAERGRKE